ncbi:MAG TPA: mycofactocin biosynthesis chaperone MftB [Acidimicrobiales bacterium]|nr:mycofactocin biosynthesis chaperone MftB [Acidimicrobiales bacterium]
MPIEDVNAPAPPPDAPLGAGSPGGPAASGPLAEDRPYRLHPQVALRDEAFGALAYHYANRRLALLRDPGLVSLVRELDRHPTLGDALAASAIPPARHPTVRAALASLLASEVICAR